MSTQPGDAHPLIARWQRPALASGVLALVLPIAAAPANPTQFFRAYLSAYLFYLGIALGSMVLLMIYHLTGGVWGFLTRQILEAAMRTLPLLALLFVPIACGVSFLYRWASPELVARDEAMQHAQLYLNPLAYWQRSAVYFALWLIVAGILDRFSRRQAEAADPSLPQKLRKLSGLGLLAYGISMNFASVDWVMSLQAPFHSTIFGPLMASGHLLSALALAIVVLAWLLPRTSLAEVVSLDGCNDLGSLLFALLLVWSYMVWFQYMLIWIANLPTDVLWYLPRSTGGWQWVAYGLFVFQFAVPLLTLLSKTVKRDVRALARVAGLILFMQLVYAFYLVVPAFPDHGIADNWMDFFTPLGLGGVWLAWFLWQLNRRPLVAPGDPSRRHALQLGRQERSAARREEALSHGS